MPTAEHGAWQGHQRSGGVLQAGPDAREPEKGRSDSSSALHRPNGDMSVSALFCFVHFCIDLVFAECLLDFCHSTSSMEPSSGNILLMYLPRLNKAATSMLQPSTCWPALSSSLRGT